MLLGYESYRMTHNMKRRVGQTHWRDRKQIDISLQLECCAISKIKNFKNNNQHNPDLYNVFHLFFEMDYGRFENGLYQKDESHQWKLVSIQDFI